MTWAATGVGVSALGVGGYLAVVFAARRRRPKACPEHGRTLDWADLPPGLLGLGLALATVAAGLALAGVLLGQWSLLPWYLALELVTLVAPGAAVVSGARAFLDDQGDDQVAEQRNDQGVSVEGEPDVPGEAVPRAVRIERLIASRGAFGPGPAGRRDTLGACPPPAPNAW